MTRIRQLSLDLVDDAPKRTITPRSGRRLPITDAQQHREQAAAAASAYIERWFARPIGTRSLERARRALQEALEPPA